jgi:bifunctional oligoribonuclease and PAP phosphatase NrnA
MQPISDIFPLLYTPVNVVITMHQKPDPDAMGSSLGLYHLLVQLGHSVTVISPTNWADFLSWMPGCKEVLDYELVTDKATAVLEKADWIFCLDFNVLHRTRKMGPKIEALNCVKILIDHHQLPEVAQFTYGISDTGKSSTAEMVYDFIVNSGNGDKMNVQMAECLYAGVMADTGSFRFPATTASVHRMVAQLKDLGLEHTKVHEAVYDNFLENRLRLIGHVLLNCMDVYYEYNTAIIGVSKADILRFDIRTGDTEGLVNYPLSIQGIKLAVLIIDRDEEIKLSFRSKGDFDVNTFARKYFEGGGHYNASGGRSGDTLEKTIQRFREAMKENKALLQ